MSDYVLSCCSPVDTSMEWVRQHDIECIPFHFEVGGVSYLDDFWGSIKPEDMYAQMLNGAESKTSQVNVNEYIDHFTKHLGAGKDILHVTLSSGISATLNSALVAAEELRDKYPDRKIIVIDSLAASGGFGVLMERLSKLRAEGKTIDEVADYATEHRLEVHHWFFTSDLTFFIRGGRVTKTAGFVGTLLNICPLLNVDYQGKLIPREKIRTKKKVIARIVEKMAAFADNGTDYDETCYITQSACPADAEAVRDLIEETFPKMKGKVKIFPIGAMIGCHTGPGTVALFFWGKKRVD